MQIAMLAAGFTRRRGRRAAPRDGRLAAQGRARAVRDGAWSTACSRAATSASSPRRSSGRSRASANTASPRATRPASRCWSTCRPGSSATSRRRSSPRCSTASRWASTRRRSWCATRASTASRCAASTCWQRLGLHARGDLAGRCTGRCAGRGGLGRSADGSAIDWRAQPAVRLGLNRVRGLFAAGAQRLLDARAAPPTRARQRLRVRQRRGPGAAGATRRPRTAGAGAGRRAAPAGRAPRAGALGSRRDPADAGAAGRCPLRRTADQPAGTLGGPRDRRRLSRSRHPDGPSSAGACCARSSTRLRVSTAAALRAFPDGRLARASGLVTHRQRPETAKGTIFVTLEDETGAVNVIVWPRVFERQRREVLGAQLMTVYGTWQCDTDSGGEVEAPDRAARRRPQRAARHADGRQSGFPLIGRDRCAAAGSARQPPRQVGADVVRILEPDRHPQHAFADARRRGAPRPACGRASCWPDG